MRCTNGLRALSIFALAGGLALPGAGHGASPVLASRDELRTCLAAEEHLQQGQARLEAALRRRDADLAALQASAQALAEESGRNRRYSSAEVEALNQRVAAHNQRIEAANRQGDRLQHQGDALNAEVAAYNGRCGTLVYRPEDRAAVVAERARTAKATEAAASAAVSASAPDTP